MTKRILQLSIATATLALLAGLPRLWAQTRTDSGRSDTKGTADEIKTYRGKIARVDGDRLIVTRRNGRRATFRVPDDTRVSIDHRSGEPEDLRRGMRVRIYAVPQVGVTGPTLDEGMKKVTGAKDTTRSAARDMGGVVRRSFDKGVTKVILKAIRIEATSRRRK
jgi:hypothetical protein